ncbi:MAG: NUDIX hydrolase YfcD [Chitinivibrionales bacterium]|nr:NUDIX hydrolase YfcD [Chitinivibrionales bacterium]
MHDEQVTVVDSRNRVTGSAPRWKMRAERLPHRATYVYVFDSAGRLFVQRRTMTKDVYPGYLDLAAGGVVLADEDYHTAALRELAEELGVTGVDIERLFDFVYVTEENHVFGEAFRCVWDGPMVLQAEEVASGRFWPIDEILAARVREQFTPDSLYALERLLAGEHS